MTTALSTRRRFLMAALLISGVSLSSLAMRRGAAWAQTAERPDNAMVQLARLLAPHDAIPDDVYVEVLDQAMSAMAGSFPALLEEVEAALDAETDGSFIDANESTQLDALRAIQNAGFFVPLLNTLKLFLYNHAAAWELMGYEGPSWQKGGYLARGAGEIDWLPEVG